MGRIDLSKVDEIIDRYVGEEGVLIQLLLDIQNEWGGEKYESWRLHMSLRRKHSSDG